jgi:hypothetical protein
MELYARKEGTNRMFLIKKLMHLRYKEGTPIAYHVNEFQGIINQLSSMVITFEDEVRAAATWFITRYLGDYYG